jgi:hypothetical protein
MGVVAAPPIRVTTTATDDGSFVLEPLAPGAWFVSFPESSTGNWARWVEAGGPPVEIQLEPPFTVPVTVSGRGGHGVPDARLVVIGTGQVSRHDFAGKVELQTDRQGRAEIPALLDVDGVFIGVVAAGYATSTWHNVTIRRGMPPIELSLEPGLTISGTVVNRDGAIISGAQVRFDRLDADGTSLVVEPWRNLLREPITASDMSGHFFRGGLAAAEYWLTLTWPGTDDRHSYARVAAGAKDQILVLDTGEPSLMSVRGKFRDAVTGAPIMQAFVRLEPDDPRLMPDGAWRPGGEFSQFEGEYEIEGAPPGRYRLHASEVGNAHASWTGPPADFDAGQHEIDIDMQPGRSLALHVSRPDGRPVAGAGVSFLDAVGKPLLLGVRPQGDGTIDTTDRYGEIVATDLPAMRIGIVVSVPEAGENAASGPLFLDLATDTGHAIEIVVP